ncbi:MAG: hypothetical protein AMXMBFR23_00710 [Chloroflexota bacterium]
MATIDLTERYFTATYLEGGPARWLVDRDRTPVRAVVLHHTAGWYGPTLGADATPEAERAQIDALARDHRARFGIGPGYHYLAFPSGRLYAAGKWGTHRAHTAGRDPASGERWNVVAIGVCAFGDFEAGPPAAGTLRALRDALDEIRRTAGAPLPVVAHGSAPTVDAAGRATPQATACPGRHLRAWLVGPDAGSEALRAAIRAARDALDRADALLSAQD